jgi:hypothetical protein
LGLKSKQNPRMPDPHRHVALRHGGDAEGKNSLDAGRERRWRVIEEIGARNADKNPEGIECDIAEAIAEARADARVRASVEYNGARSIS